MRWVEDFSRGTHSFLLLCFRPLRMRIITCLPLLQGFFISIFVGTGVIPGAAAGTRIQNLLICFEMLGAAICMFFAFPYTEFKVAGGGLSGGNVLHSISIRDVVSDTVHQFAPAYHDYVLYSDGTSKKTAKTGVSVRLPGQGSAEGMQDIHCLQALLLAAAVPFPHSGYLVWAAHGPLSLDMAPAVRTRTFMAVGQETSKAPSQNSNLLMNMELGGMSTWPKEGAGTTGGAAAAGDSAAYQDNEDDDDELGPAPPGAFTLDDGEDSPAVVGQSKFLVQELENPFAAGAAAGGEGSQGGRSTRKTNWDDVSLEDVRR